MVIPFSDSPRDPDHRPWATILLIGLNAIVAALTLPLVFEAWLVDTPLVGLHPGEELDQLTRVLWVHGFRPLAPSLRTCISAMFLHANPLHLLGNLLYLWIYGPNVEQRLGRVGFVLLYVTSGIFAAILYAITSLGSAIPAIGASGAISGVLGAYLIFFPRHAVRFWVYVTVIQIPALLVLLFFVLFDNLLPILAQVGSSTAHAAHLGGFFSGAVLAVCLRVLRATQPAPRSDPLVHARWLMDQGMLLDAHHALSALARSGKPEIAAIARRQLAAIAVDPIFQRAMERNGPSPRPSRAPQPGESR